MVQNWKKRFLRLTLDQRSRPLTATLWYYKTEDSGLPGERKGAQGALSLVGATLQGSLPSFGFCVTTAKGRAYPLRAASDADAALWCQKIEESIRACKPDGSAPVRAAAAPPPPSHQHLTMQLSFIAIFELVIA